MAWARRGDLPAALKRIDVAIAQATKPVQTSARMLPQARTQNRTVLPPRPRAQPVADGGAAGLATAQRKILTALAFLEQVGYAMPDEYARFLGRLYELVPDLHSVVLSVHCHDDLGLAVANTLTAVNAGARQVECTINGIG